MLKSKKVKQNIRSLKRIIPLLIVVVCILLFRGAIICVGDNGIMNDQCSRNFDCSNRYFCKKVIGDCAGEGVCEEKPSSCLDEWLPVCGCDGNSYPNECAANSIGVNINYKRECSGSGTTCTNNSECPSGSYCKKAPGDCTGQGVCTLVPPRCSLVYESVCGCDGKTYSSECEAISMGVNTDYIGECKTVQPPPKNPYGGIISGSISGGIIGFGYPYGSSTYSGIIGDLYGGRLIGGLYGASYGGLYRGSSIGDLYGGSYGGLYSSGFTGDLYGASYGGLYRGSSIGDLYGGSYGGLYSGGFTGGTLYGRYLGTNFVGFLGSTYTGFGYPFSSSTWTKLRTIIY